LYLQVSLNFSLPLLQPKRERERGFGEHLPELTSSKPPRMYQQHGWLQVPDPGRWRRLLLVHFRRFAAGTLSDVFLPAKEVVLTKKGKMGAVRYQVSEKN